jgi:transposase-like protein
MTAIRIYLSYSTSYRNVEEILNEQGISVDHTTIHRWVIKYIPKLLQKFRQQKLEVGENWQLDETYIKVGGVERFLYPAVDSEGLTIDFKLYKTRNKSAAMRYLTHAIKNNRPPKEVNIDGSLAN